jgi:predicted transcriptional regulator
MKKKRKRVLQTKEVLELSKRLKIKNKTKKIKSLTKKKNIKYNLAQKYLILKRK